MVPGSGGGAAGRSGPLRVDSESDRRAAAASGAPGTGNAASDRDTKSFPELNCVRRLLPASALAWAARRAERLGIGADRSLLAARLIDEETYLRLLGRELGVAFEPLDGVPRARCLLDDKALIAKAATRMLPISGDEGAPAFIVIAPGGTAVRGLIRLIENDPASAGRFRLTTAECFNRFMVRIGGDALVATATDGLRERWPMLSARSRIGWRSILSLTVVAAFATVAAVLAPTVTLTAAELMLSAIFLAWLVLRLIGACIGERRPPREIAMPDRALPVYTVLAALYREAASVPGLIAAIERLDYPALRIKCTKTGAPGRAGPASAFRTSLPYRPYRGFP